MNVIQAILIAIVVSILFVWIPTVVLLAAVLR